MDGWRSREKIDGQIDRQKINRLKDKERERKRTELCPSVHLMSGCNKMPPPPLFLTETPELGTHRVPPFVRYPRGQVQDGEKGWLSFMKWEQKCSAGNEGSEGKKS